MVRSEMMMVIAALLAGAVLGTFYFAGLAWTVTRGMTSERPASWFLGSFVIRTATVLAGFYLAGDGDWLRLLSCLLGFILARSVIMRRTHVPASGEVPVPEAEHEA